MCYHKDLLPRWFEYRIFATTEDVLFQFYNSGDESHWLKLSGDVNFSDIQISQLLGIVFCFALVIVGFWITRTKPKAQASDKILRNDFHK